MILMIFIYLFYFIFLFLNIFLLIPKNRSDDKDIGGHTRNTCFNCCLYTYVSKTNIYFSIVFYANKIFVVIGKIFGFYFMDSVPKIELGTSVSPGNVFSRVIEWFYLLNCPGHSIGFPSKDIVMREYLGKLQGQVVSFVTRTPPWPFLIRSL